MVSAADRELSGVEERPASPRLKLEVRDLSIRYGAKTALSGVNLEIREHEIFGIIEPANSGKTSFLRALNRMDDLTPSMHVDGEVLFDGRNIRAWRNVYAFRRKIGVVFPVQVRKQVGMVFQRPNPLPLSVSENVLFGYRLHRDHLGRIPPAEAEGSWSVHCERSCYGTRSRIGCTGRRSSRRSRSSRSSASRGCCRSSPRCC